MGVDVEVGNGFCITSCCGEVEGEGNTVGTCGDISGKVLGVRGERNKVPGEAGASSEEDT